jgi:adenylate kinase
MISKAAIRAKHFSSKSQLHLMLFGAPGVGKGTYSKLIEKEYDLPTFSMGEYFRGLINASETNTDPFLVKLKDTLRSGKLVDDETVVGVVKKIKQDEKYNKHMGLILDGVPRTIKQAKMLRDTGIKIDLIINFFNREEILLQKLMSRRVCPCCSRNYNIADIKSADGYEMKPLLPKKVVDECDDCAVKLVIRDDDKESVIRDRMNLYKEKTEPILDFYKTVAANETKVVDFEAKKGVGDYPHVKKIL